MTTKPASAGLGSRMAFIVLGKSNPKGLDKALLQQASYVFDLPWYAAKHELAPSKGITLLEAAIDHLLISAAKEEKGSATDTSMAEELPLKQAKAKRKALELTPGPWFDPAWYRGKYCPSALGSAGALNHFLRLGAAAGNDPCPYFQTAHYMGRYPATHRRIADHKSRNALEDYVLYGEARRYSPNQWFDEVWYVETDPLLGKQWASGQLRSGFRHYLATGADEGRDPGPTFSERRYCAVHPDVAFAISEGTMRCAFEHWILFGRDEGRSLGHETISGRQLIGAW